MKKTRKKNKNGKKVFATLCTAPAVILFIIFMVLPTLNVFRMSLYRWGGYSPDKEFVGFKNFVTLFKSDRFYQAFQNTVLLIVVVTLVTTILALILGGILSREKLKGQNFFRIIFYIPNILSVVVISAIFSAIYDPTNGLLNSILSIFNIENHMWLGESKLAIFSLIGALIWQSTGYYMVMYMASMGSIPTSIYESAEIDGAGRIRTFFQITIPLIWNNIRTTLVFFILSSINISFLLVKSMTSGGPDGGTEVFLSFMYKEAYTNSTYGYGMAIGVVIFIFSFGLSLIVNKITERDVLEF